MYPYIIYSRANARVANLVRNKRRDYGSLVVKAGAGGCSFLLDGSYSEVQACLMGVRAADEERGMSLHDAKSCHWSLIHLYCHLQDAIPLRSRV